MILVLDHSFERLENRGKDAKKKTKKRKEKRERENKGMSCRLSLTLQ